MNKMIQFASYIRLTRHKKSQHTVGRSYSGMTRFWLGDLSWQFCGLSYTKMVLGYPKWMNNLLPTPILTHSSDLFCLGGDPMFRQNMSAAGPLRVSVRKFRTIGRSTRSKKALSGGVFWASNKHTLSDLRKIWYRYGHYRIPSSAQISPKMATRWRR